MSLDRMHREDLDRESEYEAYQKPLWEQYSIKQLEEALVKARSMEEVKKKADLANKFLKISRLEQELKELTELVKKQNNYDKMVRVII